MALAPDRPAEEAHGFDRPAEDRFGGRYAGVQRSRVQAVLVIAVLVAALLALAVAAATFRDRMRQYREDADSRSAVLIAARQEVTGFTTVDYRDFDAGLGRVLRYATGDFRREYATRAADLKQVATAHRAVSRGWVSEAGISSVDPDSAQVLVAADSVVTNTSAPASQRRHYRVRLDLVRRQGRWLTARLEFVG